MTALSTQSLPLSEPSVKERAANARKIWEHRQLAIASLATACIALHLVLRFALKAGPSAQRWPLWIALAAGGTPLVLELAVRLLRGQFGSDLPAGISIVTALLLQEYLAGALVVLMLSGGQALESFAVDSASSALRAMARRLPSAAHRRVDSRLVDVPLAQITPGDTMVVFPHEICPADGIVVEGHGGMDESFLTGEPFNISKAPGAGVLCGAVNGESVLVVRAEKPAADSRYERIIRVMQASEQATPRSRRLGDRLGALYTPLALAIGLVAWAVAGHPSRFLAVMVIATPCPLLIAIPVAIIGAISISAKRGIVIKKAAALEQADSCRTVIFDKTGTLTYGEPELVEQLNAAPLSSNQVLALVASLERYSKHPLAKAILKAGEELHLALHEPTEVSEQPGRGLCGTVNGHIVQITGRGKLQVPRPDLAMLLPAAAGGLECLILIDNNYAATYRFADAIRRGSRSFVQHLAPHHHINQLILLSGDRGAEVRRLGEQVGIKRLLFEQSPEQKLAVVRDETKLTNTLYVGDGINDAPALAAATVGVALGQNSDVAGDAASVVIMDNSLQRVDEFLHISHRMRVILLQSAIGGMALSVAGMFLAAAGHLSPVAGAVTQEVIDVLAVLNALRAAFPPRTLSDSDAD